MEGHNAASPICINGWHMGLHPLVLLSPGIGYLTQQFHLKVFGGITPTSVIYHQPSLL